METRITVGPIINRCPVDFHRLPGHPAASRDEVLRSVGRARRAQPEWEGLGFAGRSDLLKRAGKRMLELRQEAIELVHDETGKTPGEMLLSELAGPLQYVKDWVRVARPALRPRRLPIPALAFPGKSGMIERVPRGVVGVIAPWNYPIGNFYKPVFAALLCGNAVVLKPSEYSPLCAAWFARVMGEFLPSGVLSVVPGGPETGRTLVSSGIDAVTFTGSYSSGREVARLAAEHLIPCSLELGGKDAAIVLGDLRNRDLDRTVSGVMSWALHNSGQACGDIERVFVEEGIADRFVSRLLAAVSALRTSSGNPESCDLGPTVTEAQLSVIEAHVSDAISRGARLLCGGQRVGKGRWFQPTILDRCDSSMKVMQEPTFGPVIPIVRVKDAEEAVRLVNLCEYGLNASVWSSDLDRATRIARRLLVGTAFVNNHAFTGAIPAAPWTGVKRTGSGIANSEFALNHYTRPRTIVVDRKKSADAWWLPMDARAEELGHCLAEAQLGKLGSALRIPWLMFQRQRSVLEFVRNPVHRAVRPADSSSGRLLRRVHRAKLFFVKLARAILRPPLASFELRWGESAIEAVFSGAPSGTFDLLPTRLLREHLIDTYRSTPFLAGVTLRAVFWCIGLSPIVMLRTWKTLDRLPLERRLEVLRAFSESDIYLAQQIALFLKMNGALCEASTSRFRQMKAHLEKGAAKLSSEATAPHSRSPKKESGLHAEL